MNEGLQILLLGILFQILHRNSTKFWIKNRVDRFWWLAPENSKNHFFTEKQVKNQDPDRQILRNRTKHKILPWSFHVTLQAKL